MKKIIFVDLNSRGNQHLTGNISFMIQFINAHKENNIYEYYFLGKSDYSNHLRNFFAFNYGTHLKSFKYYMLYNLEPEDKCVYLYPKYIDAFIYWFLKIKKVKLIGVNHGHLNSFSPAEYSNLSWLKNSLKCYILSLFDFLIVYSGHIRANLIFDHPSLLQTIKIISVHELIEIPFSLREVHKQNKQRSLLIGFKSDISNIQADCIKTIKECGFEVSLIRLDTLPISEQCDYFRSIYSLDMLLLPKDHHYYNQVSGIVNDCFALNTLPLGKSQNKHLTYSLNQLMGSPYLTIDCPYFAEHISKYLSNPEYYWGNCQLRMKRISLKNNEELSRI